MTKDLYSEEEIINGCIRNDRQLQEVLYRKYARKMYGVCMGYAGKNRDMAQDMLQEAFIKVFRNIKQYGRKGALEGWIRRIVANTAIDMLRKQSVHQNLIQEEVPESISDPDNEVFSSMAGKDILTQVARLPEGARIIFNLYALEGFSHKEIAEQLDISTGTSKSQFSRARHLLKEWLREQTG